MNSPLDSLLGGDPSEWIDALALYQSEPINELLARGQSYDDAITSWLSASTENTFRFGTEARSADKNVFLEKLMMEMEAFLCGNEKYEKERAGLFGDQSAVRTYVISAIAVAVAPSLGVTATFLAPIIALTLASMGKVSLNAWCEWRKEGRSKPPVSPPA